MDVVVLPNWLSPFLPVLRQGPPWSLFFLSDIQILRRIRVFWYDGAPVVTHPAVQLTNPNFAHDRI